MTTHSNQLAIVKQENIATIIQTAPQAYSENKTSHDRCIAAGENILNAIHQQGLNEELDQTAAAYIEKARKTLKLMNERRSSVTRLFDEVRTAFTTIENAIDPTKVGSLPHRLQEERNAFAAKKRAEEQERLRKEMEARQRETELAKLKNDIETAVLNTIQKEAEAKIKEMLALERMSTLENYQATIEKLQNLSHSLLIAEPQVFAPAWVRAEVLQSIKTEIYTEICKKQKASFEKEVQNTLATILERIPSRKMQLEEIAKADAQKAEAMKAEMLQREAEFQKKLEEERKAKEEEEKAKAELKRAQAEAMSLFETQATMAEYQPKTKVSKKIKLLNPEGILPIIMLWWQHEGKQLSTEELAKTFKKQISFCEKIGNKEAVFIEDESVEYVDEVKAK